MTKEMEMQLSTLLGIFKKHVSPEYLGVYISELESNTLTVPQTIFALRKLLDYCNRNVGWEQEQIELEGLISQIEKLEQEKAQTAKSEAPINRFWVSFREWFYSELPRNEWLYPQYILYDNWDGGTYYLNINFESIFRQYFGITYDNRYENETRCKLSDIKLLIELLYKELIKIEVRYDYTIQINKLFSRFMLPFELKSGKVTKKVIKHQIKTLQLLISKCAKAKFNGLRIKYLGPKG